MADEKNSIKHRVIKRRWLNKKLRRGLKCGLILLAIVLAIYMFSNIPEEHTQEISEVHQTDDATDHWDYLLVLNEPEETNTQNEEIERLKAENAQLIQLQNSLKQQIENLIQLQHKLSGELAQQQKFHNIQKNRRVGLQERLKLSEEKITSLNQKIHILEEAQKQRATNSYYNAYPVNQQKYSPRRGRRSHRRTHPQELPEPPKPQQINTVDNSQQEQQNSITDEATCWKSLERCMKTCQSGHSWRCYSDCLSSVNYAECLSVFQSQMNWFWV